MPNTPEMGFPYPPGTGVPPNVPYWMQQLAASIELKMPRGRLARGIRTAQAGPVAAGAGWVDVASLSASVTIATARELDVFVFAQATSDQAGTSVGIRVRNVTTGGVDGEQTVTIPVANQGAPLATFIAPVENAGTHQYRVQIAQFGGPGGAYLTAKTALIVVNDVGPA